jgi:lipoprotein NlpI
MSTRLAIRCLVLCAVWLGAARADDASEALDRARAALERKDFNAALELAGKAIAADPKDPRGYLLRARTYEALQKHDKAVSDLDKCLQLDPKNAEAYDLRGSEQFKRGKIAESLADFDAFLKLRPEEAPGHWKRGITLYYLDRFDDGRKQFQAYEKKDTNDVENAVWHFLCAVRVDGVEKARASILTIGKDTRVPMMQVYSLYKGELKPADVLSAAEAGNVPAAQRKERLFYAHLYLGLYYDVQGDKKRALEHMDLAAGKYRIGHYMGDVARIHADLLRKDAKEK